VKFDVPAIGVAEFALRASTQPGWSILLIEPAQAAAATRALLDELRDLDDLPIVAVTPSTPEALVQNVHTADDRTVVLSGLEGFTDGDWQHLDLLRSRLAREGSTILVLSQAAASRLAESAPNLSSWLGSTVWRADLGANILSPLETEQRLIALRESTGVDDAEVVARAERGELPADPEFAEWLILLGRGDLVPRG
jgi:hypothetical protein